MITLKQGKPFEMAFLIYTCGRCGFKGFMAKNDEIRHYGTGKRYSEEMYTKITERFDGYTSDHTLCPSCNNAIGYSLYSMQRDKEYMKELIGVPVTLEDGEETKLTINDLFY